MSKDEAGVGRLTIILRSGGYDHLHQGMSIVRSAVANEMEVHVFFTYWALNRWVRKGLDSLDVPEEYSTAKQTIAENLRLGKVETPSQMLKEAKDSGRVYVYACSQSMGLLGIRKDELPPEVDKMMGYVTFLNIAETARVNYMI